MSGVTSCWGGMDRHPLTCGLETPAWASYGSLEEGGRLNVVACRRCTGLWRQPVSLVGDELPG